MKLINEIIRNDSVMICMKYKKQNTVFGSKNTSWKEKIIVTMLKDLNIARRWRCKNTTTFRGKPRKMRSVGNGRICIQPAAFVFPRRQTALTKGNSSNGMEFRAKNRHLIFSFTLIRKGLQIGIMARTGNQMTTNALRSFDAANLTYILN